MDATGIRVRCERDAPWTAWYALRNEISGEMVAKTADTEFLRLISGTRQINKAFERSGISVGDEKAG